MANAPRPVPGSLAALAVAFLTGCTAFTPPPETGPWGEPPTLRPGWQKIRSAAVQAAGSPWTWAPLLGAGILQVDDLDHRIADWAGDETPLFGSQESAEDWSDHFKTAATASYIASGLLAPSGTDGKSWWRNKAKGFTVGWAAATTNTALTNWGKSEAARLRPDGSERRSFPSGHASSSTLRATLTAENLRAFPISRRSRSTLKGLAYGFAAGSSWARVEAQKHFPADVLVGASLGHFLGEFFIRAFPVLEREGLRISLSGDRHRVSFVLSWSGGTP